MEKFDIVGWSDYFDKTKGKVDPKVDFLKSSNVELLPGRFYVLKYMARTKEMFNTRPVILSLGLSKKDPESYLCIDLSVIPKKARLKFIEMFFNLYANDISKNMEESLYEEDADKQKEIRDFTYENLCKATPMLPVKNALKRYKLKNTVEIYSVPFFNVFKIIGDYCDENYYKNGSVSDAQKEFISKMQRIRK